MASQHLYPCPHCQAKVPISTTRSGQEIECQTCNQVFEAPKLQILRQHLATGKSVKSVPFRDHFASRALYTGGLLLVLIGLAGGLSLHYYSNQLIGQFDFEEAMNSIADQAQSLPPTAVYQEWFYVEKEPELSEWREHPVVGNRTQGKILKTISYFVLGLAAVGLILILCSPLVGRSKRRL